MSRFTIICVALLVASASSLPHQKIVVPCPDGFVKIHDRCYYFSIVPDTFDQSEFNCRERQSHLAVISGKKQDYLLKEYLKRQYVGPDGNLNSHAREIAQAPRWLGGQYNWKKMQWNWRLTGRPIKYQSFSSTSEEYSEWDCLLTDPMSNYLWTAKPCFEKNYYICQTHPSAKQQRPAVQNMTNANGIMNTQPGYYVVTERPPPNKCPRDFQLVRKKCYFFSKDGETWQDAFHKCEGMKSQLAIFKNAGQQKKLKAHANKMNMREPFWSGGRYDWKNNIWKWAKTGRRVTVPVQKTSGNWLCMIWDPAIQTGLSSDSCYKKNRYVCQAGIVGSSNKRAAKRHKMKVELQIKLYNSTESPAKSVNSRTFIT